MPDRSATRAARTRLAAPTRRPPTPEDLYRLRVPTDPRLSPDGAFVAFTVQTVAPTYDGYRQAIWLAPTDGSRDARQVTLGAKHDRHPRFSPDGQTLAFLSDRRTVVEEEPMPADETKRREDGVQVHLLSQAGGEARRLTDLPRGVDSFAWSPDGTQLAVLSASRGATRKDDARLRGTPRTVEPGKPPASDYHYFDRLGYQFNGAGFIVGQEARLWIVDVASGAARLLVETLGGVGEPAWSPDGRRMPSRCSVAAIETSCSARTSMSWTLGRAPERRSPAAPIRCSSTRPGCRTASRSPRSGVDSLPTRIGTTSGSLPPTAAIRDAVAAATCRVITTSCRDRA